jgi:hypothetical protein
MSDDDDDEIWADEDEPTASSDQYDALLVDIKDQDLTHSTEVIEAATDAEAIAEAREWARTECENIGKALLIVTGGGIRGSHSEVIEP